MIVFDNVSKIYDGPRDTKSREAGAVRALANLNLTIDDGEFVFVVGDSGSGKSTFLRLLLRELSPTEGTVSVGGRRLDQLKQKDLPYYRRKMGVVFQDFRLLQDRNVYENVALAQRVVAAPHKGIKVAVTEALTMVGLSAKYKSFPSQLSGGEQQRVAIARALVNQPDILLADEPTGNLDPTNSEEIMKLLVEANRRGTTVVVVTHDMEMVSRMNKRVITLQKGVLISDEEGEREKSPKD